MSTKQLIEKTITIGAPRAKVFRALTDAQTLMQWFPSKAESDPRPGGKLALGWEFKQAEQNGTQTTQFVDVQPEEHLSYAWNGGPGAEHTLVTFDLASDGDQTTVNLKHGGWPVGDAGQALIERHDMPWSFYMANLKSYLEAGGGGRLWDR
jgi:uncharacterized protein YndB with AHSA1/START domain